MQMKSNIADGIVSGLKPGITLRDALKRARELLKREKQFEIHSLQDVSHAVVKRYSAVLLVGRDCSREALREIIPKAIKQIKHSNYHRSQLSADRWKGQAAHVVWLFVAADLDDVENTNWLCRAEWIDPGFVFEPPLMKGDEQVESIQVFWNNSYEKRKRFWESRKL